MKKLLALLLAIAMLSTMFVGCSAPAKEEPIPDAQEEEKSEPVVTFEEEVVAQVEEAVAEEAEAAEVMEEETVQEETLETEQENQTEE